MENSNIDTTIQNIILQKTDKNQKSCKNAWGIAFVLNIDKHVIACACDILKIKIKQCQCGAF